MVFWRLSEFPCFQIFPLDSELLCVFTWRKVKVKSRRIDISCFLVHINMVQGFLDFLSMFSGNISAWTVPETSVKFYRDFNEFLWWFEALGENDRKGSIYPIPDQNWIDRSIEKTANWSSQQTALINATSQSINMTIANKVFDWCKLIGRAEGEETFLAKMHQSTGKSDWWDPRELRWNFHFPILVLSFFQKISPCL